MFKRNSDDIHDIALTNGGKGLTVSIFGEIPVMGRLHCSTK